MATLQDIGKWRSGGTPSRQKSEYFGNGIPWVKSGDLKDGPIDRTEEQITELGSQNSSAKVQPIGTVSMALYGATIGKLGIMTFPAATNQACANVIPNSLLVQTLYLYFYLLSQRQVFIDSGQGGAQPNISQEIVRAHPIPVAPVNEQERIVRKLKAVLDKVDSIDQRLKRIPTILKRFRQSVLAAASSGRLTADWRGDNVVEAWRAVQLSKVIVEKPKNGYSAKPVSHVTPYRVLTLTATTSGKFDPAQYKFIDQAIPDESDLWLKPEDILVQRGNTIEYVGVSAIYDGEPKQFIYPDLMMRLRVNAEVSTKFLHFVLSWEKTRQYLRDRATGTAGNMPKINQATLLSTPIPLPSSTEQEEIVRRVESLFTLADQLEARYKKGKAYVDKLTQSILAKAFRGELVPQDPNDEPAERLLERIRAEAPTGYKTSRSI